MYAAPDFKLGELYKSVFILAFTIAPAHIGSGSNVIARVVPSSLQVFKILDASFIKEGACLVDVGINRIERDGKSTIVGDINQASVMGKASALTPVPKGIGPMTIAMLVENTVLSAELSLN